MANEFKIKKGLIVTGATGGTVVDIQGSQGQLFSVTDNLTGSNIFAVSDISGVPILQCGVDSGYGNVSIDMSYNNGYTLNVGSTSSGSIITTGRIFGGDNFYIQNEAIFADGPVVAGLTTYGSTNAKVIVKGNQSFGLPGVNNTNGRYLSIEGNADGAAEGSGRLFFTEHNSTTAAMDNYGMSLGYRGGGTSIVGASGNTWTGLTQIGNGQWGMWGHNNDATGALIMSGDRAATYVEFHSNDIKGAGNIYVADKIIHTGDTNTYMQFHAADQWRVVTGGTERLEVNNTTATFAGNAVFPGEEANSFKIAFTGASASSGLSTVDQSGAGLYIGANSRVNNSGVVVFHDTLLPSSGIYFDGWQGDDMEFYTGSTGNPTKRLTINSSGNAIFTGNVGINQTVNPTNYTLEVNGAVEGDSFSVQGAPARIFAPSGATYNGSGTQTGYLIVKLPDNGTSGINNMMTGVIRVFDYTHNESFDVHFAGYWYSGYNWTNCSAWIESSANDDRNFTVRFGEMTGSAGANTRPYITIGEAASTWTYCKFSVINYEPGHSNYEAYKWDSGWSMDISATNPGNVLVTKSNAQVNNWARSGQDVYYGSGTGNVGINTASPNQKLHVNGATQLGDISATASFGTVALKVVEGTIATGPTLGSGAVGAQAVLYSNGLFGMYTGVSGSGDTWMQSQRNDANTATYDILLNPAGGRVAIGHNDPTGKLDVYRPDTSYSVNRGDTLSRAGLVVKSSGAFDSKITFSSGAGSRQYIQALNNAATTGRDISINPYGGNVGIGTSAPGQILTVNGRALIQNSTTPFYIKVNSTYKSWVHHIASNDTYVLAPSTADGGETWDWPNQTSFSTSGVVTANNFVLSSDKRNKTKIEDLTGNNVDISWKSFEMKGNEGEYRTGVIAQELEENHPEFVNTDDRGFKSVKYIDLLIAKIAELEARLEILEK